MERVRKGFLPAGVLGGLPGVEQYIIAELSGLPGIYFWGIVGHCDIYDPQYE